MRKKAIIIMCFQLVCAALTGCADGGSTVDRPESSSAGSSSSSASKKTTEAETEEDTEYVTEPETEPIERDELYGSWRAYDFYVDGLYFDGTGKGGILMDTTDYLCYKGGCFVTDTDDIPESDVSWDGRTMTINYEGVTLAKMIKADADDNPYIDGDYLLIGGTMKEAFQEDGEEQTMIFTISDKESYITLLDVFEYTFDDKYLYLKGGDDIVDADEAESGLEYSIEGSKLSLWFSDEYGIMMFKV